MVAFESGLELSGRFYSEAVRPALDAAFPGLPHAAALMGRGSEVLGFDDEMSTDHDWNARVLVFLGPDDLGRRDDVDAELRRRLPGTFRGCEVAHEVHGVRDWFLDGLAVDVDAELSAADWLSLPEQ